MIELFSKRNQEKKVKDMKKATATQFSFISTLQSERQVPAGLVESMRQLWAEGRFDESTADSYIKILQSFPIDEKAVEYNHNLVGYHSLGKQLFRVYRSKNDCMYLKELVVDNQTGKYKFAIANHAIAKKLRPNTKLSNEKANEIEKNIRLHNVAVEYDMKERNA